MFSEEIFAHLKRIVIADAQLQFLGKSPENLIALRQYNEIFRYFRNAFISLDTMHARIKVVPSNLLRTA